jgi:hypothetical protein
MFGSSFDLGKERAHCVYQVESDLSSVGMAQPLFIEIFAIAALHGSP